MNTSVRVMKTFREQVIVGLKLNWEKIYYRQTVQELLHARV